MPPVVLQLNVPVETDTPILEVAAGLPAGDHQIKLEVINDHQVKSAPVIAIVTIVQA